MDEQRMGRREFLRDAAAASAAVGAAIALPHAAGAAETASDEVRKTRSYNPNMEYRRLGKTGLWVSAVCLGGHWKRIDKVTGKGGDSFETNRHDVISRCLEVGINYVDACMDREIMVYSAALKGRREKMYFGYSWHCWEPRVPQYRTTKALLDAFDKGLKQGGLDYVDLWRVTMHDRGSRHTAAEVDGLIGALDKAKKAGKARFTGFSSHDRPWIKMVIDSHPRQIDAICTPYTANSKELPTDSMFEAVRKHDVGIFGIKPFASNSLFKGDSSPTGPHAAEDDKRARQAVRHILGNPAITAPIPGLISTHQVDNMVAAIKERRELDATEKAELEAAGRRMWANLPDGYDWLRDWEYV